MKQEIVKAIAIGSFPLVVGAQDPWSPTQLSPAVDSCWHGVPLNKISEPSSYRGRSNAGPAIQSVPAPHNVSEFMTAVVSLEAQIRELRELRKMDQQAIAELTDRIRELEVELLPFLAEQDGGEIVANSHHQWIEAHLDVLREYPNRWVAIDAVKGIVVDAATGDELADKLDAMPSDVQAQLLMVNTTRYV